MAKPSPAAVHTPRPASFRSSSSTRASVGSSSTPTPRPPLPAAATNNPRDAASDSKVTAPAETTAMIEEEEEEEEEEEPLPDQISLALAELRGGRGLSPRSKRLVFALVEAAAAELCPTATTLRLRRAAFWGKVRVWILAATVATVFAIDVALAVALVSRRGNDHYDALPPT